MIHQSEEAEADIKHGNASLEIGVFIITGDRGFLSSGSDLDAASSL